MNICILMGSIREDDNTAILLHPFIEELEAREVKIQYIWLYDKHFETCRSCFVCEKAGCKINCTANDEMTDIYTAILMADCIIFATPIYSWFCTAPMKAIIDRLSCIDKLYEDEKTSYGLLSGKYCAAVTTFSNENEYGADLFEEAVKRLTKKFHLSYLGMLEVRDADLTADFQTEEAARVFAVNIITNYHNSMMTHIYKF